eukprot:CAMPEP_0173407970 /NCGR_PEP_ID=MMETSP1356-20130122/68519_1 /TAXON_ID=77927 ORGANISM="Hemiselmis virescens, Strain PCC157" /NCGR_SAMPLE_ID=MMETSP1356 /ASSEMBLY_ACC=CAM_ASM_000847 /LENGTH=74 /DNA_ID=CAMNT_0014369205 /DNA_START=536 /DNA_END=757 /DNA_ORIENTATION=+
MHMFYEHSHFGRTITVMPWKAASTLPSLAAVRATLKPPTWVERVGPWACAPSPTYPSTVKTHHFIHQNPQHEYA